MAQDSEDTDVTVVTDHPKEGVVTTGDACLVVFYGKDIGKRYFLRHKEEIMGRSESVNICIDQDSVSRQHAKICTVDGRSWIYDLGSTNGTFVNDMRMSDCALRDGDLLRIGQTIFKYLSGSNIESKYHEEIYRLTTIDGLTQTFNKRYFLEALDRELTRALRYKRTLALVLFDIDFFKKINDTHGHLAGDFVLRELAGIVTQNIRRQDVFARYGGEEFALILPEVSEEGALMVSEKIRELIEIHTFSFSGQRVEVTVSLGVHIVGRGAADVDERDIEQVIAVADQKLYRAKQEGRNRVCA